MPFKVSKSKDLKGQPIAFFDRNDPENADTYANRDILLKNKAKWSPYYIKSGNFPEHGPSQGVWFWWIGADSSKWKWVFEKHIGPTILDIENRRGVTSDDSKDAVLSALNTILSDVVKEKPITPKTGVGVDIKEIERRAENFKNKIINIRSDEDFKKSMKDVMNVRRNVGYAYSLINSILILIQAPDCPAVYSKTDWQKYYNRTIKDDAKPIMLYRPTGISRRDYNSDEKVELLKKFQNKDGKPAKSVDELTPSQKHRFEKQVGFGLPLGHARSVTYYAYCYTDTELIPGTEDTIQAQIDRMKDIPWHREGDITDDVKPIYDSMLKYIEELGITIEYDDENNTQLGTSKGRSYGGKVLLPINDGRDVGITKVLAHELAHEFLHQRYLSKKNPEFEKFFVGREGGRSTIEQQAEVTAWMVMDMFGFDVKLESINYTLLWGGNEENMVTVFDTIASVGTNVVKKVSEKMGGLAENVVTINEVQGVDVAKKMGFEKEYGYYKNKKSLNETFYRLSGLKRKL